MAKLSCTYTDLPTCRWCVHSAGVCSPCSFLFHSTGFTDLYSPPSPVDISMCQRHRMGPFLRRCSITVTRQYNFNSILWDFTICILWQEVYVSEMHSFEYQIKVTIKWLKMLESKKVVLRNWEKRESWAKRKLILEEHYFLGGKNIEKKIRSWKANARQALDDKGQECIILQTKFSRRCVS